MPVRSDKLPKSQTADRFEATTFWTVHQSPPKNIPPSKTPAAKAEIKLKYSFIVFLLLPNLIFFFGNPIPGIKAANRQTDDEQRQRP